MAVASSIMLFLPLFSRSVRMSHVPDIHPNPIDSVSSATNGGRRFGFGEDDSKGNYVNSSNSFPEGIRISMPEKVEKPLVDFKIANSDTELRLVDTGLQIGYQFSTGQNYLHVSNLGTLDPAARPTPDPTFEPVTVSLATITLMSIIIFFIFYSQLHF